MEVLYSIIAFFIMAIPPVLGVLIAIYAIIALRKYIKSGPVRKEKKEMRRTLAETLKAHRVEAKMTQEFVAETIGVSRQSVSKWESGQSDPSTSNLMALAKLYKVPAEELLNSIVEHSEEKDL